MTATGHVHGQPVYFDETSEVWRFVLDDSLCEKTWEDMPCAKCGEFPTEDGHDPCIAHLPGVRNACCGHGHPEHSYIQFYNGIIVRGFDVIEEDGFEYNENAKMKAKVLGIITKMEE